MILVRAASQADAHHAAARPAILGVIQIRLNLDLAHRFRRRDDAHVGGRRREMFENVGSDGVASYAGWQGKYDGGRLCVTNTAQRNRFAGTEFDNFAQLWLFFGDTVVDS